METGPRYAMDGKKQGCASRFFLMGFLRYGWRCAPVLAGIQAIRSADAWPGGSMDCGDTRLGHWVDRARIWIVEGKIVSMHDNSIEVTPMILQISVPLKVL